MNYVGSQGRIITEKLLDELGWVNPLMELDLIFNLDGIVGSSSLAICFLNHFELCGGYDNEGEMNHEIFLNREKTRDLNASS